MATSSFRDSLIVVAARGWIRHAPTTLFKEWLWRFAHWRSHAYTARVATGFLMRGRSNDIVQGYVYYFGVWEPNLTGWLRSRLDGIEGAVFVDIGANVGYYALLAHSLLGRTSSVVAVEASPRIHALLAENVRLNGFERIRTVNCAAAAGPGTLTLFHGSDDNLGGTTANPGIWDGDGAFVVETRALADILTADEIARVRLIKIDVEGGECAVIDGLRPLLARLPAEVEVVVEINPGDAGTIFATFAAAGFHAYGLVNHYSYKSYLARARIDAPVRLHQLPTRTGDFIFSRRDQGSL